MGWGSSTRRGGGQKVWYVPRNQGNQTFLAGYPGILPGYPEIARKVWEKKVWVQFSFPKNGIVWPFGFLLPCFVVIFVAKSEANLRAEANCGLVGFSLDLLALPKLLQKNSLQRKCFGAINFVIITKESLYKANSLACFLVKRDPPVAATLQRKSSGGIFL